MHTNIFLPFPVFSGDAIFLASSVYDIESIIYQTEKIFSLFTVSGTFSKLLIFILRSIKLE